MLKKIIGGLILGMGMISSFSFAVNPNTGNFGDSTKTSSIGVAGAGQAQGEGFIDVVKGIINWILGILSLIALVVLLWGGFQMVTAAGDDGKYKNGFKILKQAGVGLVFIGVAWFVVSLVFSVISTVVGQ